MEEAETSQSSPAQTTFFRIGGGTKLPHRKGPSGRKGERSSQKFVPQENVSLTPLTHLGVWLDLDKALDKKKIIDDWCASLLVASCTTYHKLEPQDLQMVYETTL